MKAALTHRKLTVTKDMVRGASIREHEKGGKRKMMEEENVTVGGTDTDGRASGAQEGWGLGTRVAPQGVNTWTAKISDGRAQRDASTRMDALASERVPIMTTRTLSGVTQ